MVSLKAARSAGLFLIVLLVFPANLSAAVLYVDLGTAAPPSTLGTLTVTPFSLALQAAVTNGTSVTVIPGSPIPGNLTSSVSLTKRTVPGGGWSSWSHGYTGAVYSYTNNSAVTLTLPPNTNAFYFYVEPNNLTHSYTITTNSGTTSGAISVFYMSGARGSGFYTTQPGETIVSITITGGDSSVNAIGEFGAGTSTPAYPNITAPTIGEWGMIILSLSLLVSGAIYIRRRQIFSA